MLDPQHIDVARAIVEIAGAILAIWFVCVFLYYAAAARAAGRTVTRRPRRRAGRPS